jgi:hypothetical protein
MALHRTVSDALQRLARQEEEFLRGQFLAPVLRGQAVRVRIAGVCCELRAEPRNFAGWGVFAPLSYSAARLQRPATMGERRQYLDLFPAASLVLCARDAGGDDSAVATWLALPAGSGDDRFNLTGMAPVRLVEEAELFDTVRARFDGANFWFEQLDGRADPGAAAYLRQCIGEGADPRRVDRPGLTRGQREAYAAVHAERLRRAEAVRRAAAEDARASGERRLCDALWHAGARLNDFADRGDVYSVMYTVDGRRHTSVVGKADLTVQTAGICLSGEDRKFDLPSLIGVLREGGRRGRF